MVAPAQQGRMLRYGAVHRIGDFLGTETKLRLRPTLTISSRRASVHCPHVLNQWPSRCERPLGSWRSRLAAVSDSLITVESSAFQLRAHRFRAVSRASSDSRDGRSD